jgi:hypothetical protein
MDYPKTNGTKPSIDIKNQPTTIKTAIISTFCTMTPSMRPTDNPKAINPTESDVYDRQIRLWGAEAQVSETECFVSINIIETVRLIESGHILMLLTNVST